MEDAMKPFSKPGEPSKVVNNSIDLDSELVRPMDGIYDIHGHGLKDGSLVITKNINGESTPKIFSPEVIARYLRRFAPDFNGFRCFTCYGAKTSEVIKKVTGKPAVGATTKIQESKTGIRLIDGGKVNIYP